VTRVRLMRHRQTKGAATDRLDLPAQDTCSLLYPELCAANFVLAMEDQRGVGEGR